MPENIETAKPRLFFVDKIRVILVTLVILVHLTITYGSPVGSWYYHEGAMFTVEAIPFVLFQGISQSFFMGFFFLIAGYFTPPSYDRKGAKQFFKDRLIRLGIPIVIFVLLVDPVMQYALASAAGFSGSFLDFLGVYVNNINGLAVGPLWFLETLLFFAGIYVVWRWFSKQPIKSYAIPKNITIALFALALGAVTFVVRIWFPVGWTFTLLNLQFPFFPQYIALFIVGLIAFRGNWLMTIPAKTGRLWFKVAILLILLLPVLFILGLTIGNFDAFMGGLNWQAATYSFWEQALCIAVVIGLSVWFRERFNSQNRLTKALSDSAYTAYIIQAPVLVFLALGLQSLFLPLLVKFALVAPVAVLLCFLLGYLIKKLPKANRVL